MGRFGEVLWRFSEVFFFLEDLEIYLGRFLALCGLVSEGLEGFGEGVGLFWRVWQHLGFVWGFFFAFFGRSGGFLRGSGGFLEGLGMFQGFFWLFFGGSGDIWSGSGGVWRFFGVSWGFFWLFLEGLWRGFGGFFEVFLERFQSFCEVF